MLAIHCWFIELNMMDTYETPIALRQGLCSRRITKVISVEGIPTNYLFRGRWCGSYLICGTTAMMWSHGNTFRIHYNDVIMGAMASQITSLTIVYTAVYSGVDQRKRQSSASLAFMRWIHWWPVNSPQKWPVKRNLFPFDDVIIFLDLFTDGFPAEGANNADLWCYLSCKPEQAIEQTVVLIRDVTWCHNNGNRYSSIGLMRYICFGGSHHIDVIY